jgi:hypothetical protein
MLVDQRLERGQRRVVPAEPERRLDGQLLRGNPQLLDSSHFLTQCALELEIREGRPTPQ